MGSMETQGGSWRHQVEGPGGDPDVYGEGEGDWRVQGVSHRMQVSREGNCEGTWFGVEVLEHGTGQSPAEGTRGGWGLGAKRNGAGESGGDQAEA